MNMWEQRGRVKRNVFVYLDEEWGGLRAGGAVCEKLFSYSCFILPEAGQLTAQNKTGFDGSQEATVVEDHACACARVSKPYLIFLF